MWPEPRAKRVRMELEAKATRAVAVSTTIGNRVAKFLPKEPDKFRLGKKGLGRRSNTNLKQEGGALWINADAAKRCALLLTFHNPDVSIVACDELGMDQRGIVAVPTNGVTHRSLHRLAHIHFQKPNARCGGAFRGGQGGGAHERTGHAKGKKKHLASLADRLSQARGRSHKPGNVRRPVQKKVSPRLCTQAGQGPAKVLAAGVARTQGVVAHA